MSLLYNARLFAQKAHEGQKRKYVDKPYFVHPERVANMIQGRPDSTTEMIATSYLHDVVEDCGVTIPELQQEFGEKIAILVGWLTNPSKGSKAPRAERKRLDREHIKAAPWEAKIIKLADRIDNLTEVGQAPKDFRDLYCAESQLLLEALIDTDNYFTFLLRRQIDIVERMK